MISLNRKHELFRQYKNGTVTFDHYNPLKNNFTTTLRLAKNSYFQRKFAECSNNSRDTWKTLNCLIRCKKTSKDATLNHMAPRSVTPHPMQKYLITIFQTLPPILIAIFLIQIFLRCTRGKFIFLSPCDSEEIVNLIRRQQNKSTDLMNIPVFIYKILAP